MRPFEVHPYRRDSKRTSKSSSGPTSIDRLHDPIKTIERNSSNELVHASIEKQLKMMASTERRRRESTLTVSATGTLTHKQILSFMNDVWTQISTRQNSFQSQEDLTGTSASMKEDPLLQEARSLPVKISADKDNVYVGFVDCAVKNLFLDYIQLQDYVKCPIKRLIVPPKPQTGYHFARKMIRIEITNVPPSLATDFISSTIKSGLPDDCKFSQFRNGKPHGPRRNRSVMFQVNDSAFRHLFVTLEGYITATIQMEPRVLTTKLYFKVNCKAWRCNKCYTISSLSLNNNDASGIDADAEHQDYLGKHRCRGRICTRCSGKGHEADRCPEKSRFCGNCKRLGHRSKDLSCPTYLRAVLKELQRIDIPLEFLEEKDLRMQLAAAILV